MQSRRRPGAIAMYHVGRCGSTVVGQLLDQHPSVFWDGEIYFQKWQEANLEFREFSNVEFLRRRMLASGRRYYGFEIKFLDSLHIAIIGSPLEKTVTDFSDAGVTKHLVLERRNYLRMLISWVVARKTKQHHIGSNQLAKLTRIRIDTDSLAFGTVSSPRSLVEWFETIEGSYLRLRELLVDLDVLELTYEDDIQRDPYHAYLRICKFLGIEEGPAAIELSRTNPFPISDLLENYDDVRNALRPTKYAWMLDD